MEAGSGLALVAHGSDIGKWSLDAVQARPIKDVEVLIRQAACSICEASFSLCK